MFIFLAQGNILQEFLYQLFFVVAADVKILVFNCKIKFDFTAKTRPVFLLASCHTLVRVIFGQPLIFTFPQIFSHNLFVIVIAEKNETAAFRSRQSNCFDHAQELNFFLVLISFKAFTSVQALEVFRCLYRIHSALFLSLSHRYSSLIHQNRYLRSYFHLNLIWNHFTKSRLS